MDFVCNDSDQMKWFFDGKRFVRMNSDGTKQGAHISPQNLPDPVSLWNTRCDKFNVPHGTQYATYYKGFKLNEPYRLKPTDAVFSLFNYKIKEAA